MVEDAGELPEGFLSGFEIAGMDITAWISGNL
jgi:hypothetical protein